MDCRELFHAMAERFDGAAAGDWAAVFSFRIAGPRGGDFVVRIADGACTVEEGVPDDATSTVTTDDDTWLGIVDGSVNPMGAFMGDKIKIQGNMGDVLKLQDRSLFKAP